MGCFTSLLQELPSPNEITPIPKKRNWLQKYESDLQQELHVLKWREDVSGRFGVQTFPEFKITIDTDNLLLIAAYFEYDDARIMAIKGQSINQYVLGHPFPTTLGYFFDYLALFGSLEAIEIAAWYMTQNAFYCTLHPDTTYDFWNLYGRRNLREKYIDPSFRSYPNDRARNPLDIFNIWQNVAWKSLQLLQFRFPNDVANIVLGYCDMQSLAPPKYRHGLFIFFLFWNFFLKKKHMLFFFVCIRFV